MSKWFRAIFLPITLMAATSFMHVAFAEDTSFITGVAKLTGKDFKSKEQAIDALMAGSNKKNKPDVRVLSVFQSLLNGKLYYYKIDKDVVYKIKVDSGISTRNVISDETINNVSARKIKRISLNNKLRRKLNAYIAELSLLNENPKVRISAIQQMMGTITSDTLAALQKRLINEKNESVLDAFKTLVALVKVDDEDKSHRLSALSDLSESLEPKARNKIISLLEKNEDGVYIETDKDFINKAIKAKQKIDGRRSFYSFFEKIFFGLSLGSVLLLAAIGLAITFGVMGVINMAHGELIMIGAYTTYVVQMLMPNHIEISLLVAVPAAFVVSGLFGIAIERGVIRFLYGRPLETLLATFGISLILQQLVRSIFSPLNRSVETPIWMSGALEFNPIFSITYNRLTIIFFSLFIFALLMLILKRTSLGLKVRAVSQNRPMARAMGIRSEWVDALTFGLGSGIAGIAGVALSQLTNVGPNLGQSYIIDSFLVVVFGGVGNLWGTLVSAMSLGVFNKFLEPAAGSVLAKILILVFIILFIQKKPRGLFPQKGRAAEN